MPSICARAGVDPSILGDPAARVPHEVVARVWGALAAGDEAFGLLAARLVETMGRSVFEYAMFNAAETTGPGLSRNDRTRAETTGPGLSCPFMENIGRTPDSVYGTTHGPRPGNYPGDGLSGADNAGSPVSGGFHVYATQWSPNEIDFCVDGNLYWKVTPSMLPAGATWGSRPGSPYGSSTWPQQMLVDYVRVYAPQ